MGTIQKTAPIRAVIFDLDGVLTDSARYHYLAWKRLADRLAIPFDETYNEKLKGISRMESLELILRNAPVAYTDAEKQAFAEEKNNTYRQMIQQITPADILPGISGFLQELRAAGIKTGVASASRNACDIISSLRLGTMLDHIADAAGVPRAKPAPDIFLAVSGALGVPPKYCVGIEDARAGIQAINAAGMFSVGVGTPTEMYEADLVLQSTAELTLARLSGLLVP